jgi:hypothetical protein
MLAHPALIRDVRRRHIQVAAVVWGDAIPDDVWKLASRFREYGKLFGDTTYVVRKWKGSCAAEADDIVG